MFVMSRRMIAVAGSILLGAAWLLALATAGATALEFFLKIRSHFQEQAGNDSIPTPRLDRLDLAYEAFAVQYLHPQYLFFFPLEPAERVRLSNEVCSIDGDGFRGPGPAHAGGRRLAFLLGGSSAFGWYASSDATTITGYLNRLQDQYFFVNAGVPSFSTTQEMVRLAFQILEYHPALVLVYDGANDAGILDWYNRARIAYPPGTPENFDNLSALFEGRNMATLVADGQTSRRWSTGTLLLYLFPELADRLHARFGRNPRFGDGAPTNPGRLPDSTLQASVARYLSNLTRMRDLTTAEGGRFIAVLQPIAQLHRHLAPEHPFEDDGIYARFHDAVVSGAPHDIEFHDFGNLFDQHYAIVPVMDGDITDETVFVDDVHIYDPGSELVARRLSALLR